MSEYLYVDKAGKVLKREEKGRGRPKTGSVKKDDGNWHITVNDDCDKSVKSNPTS